MLVMQMIGTAFVLIVLWMTLFWIIYFFQKNAGIVDIAWPLGFVLVAIVYAAMGDGEFWFKWTFTAMVTMWGLRLGLYLSSRYKKGVEDPRYTEMIKAWGPSHTVVKVYLMFLFQGFLILILSLPMLVVSLNRYGSIGTVQIVAIVLWALSLWGEYTADKQMARFKAYAFNKTSVCEEGWWFYSRHPNYFFEWLIWVSYCLYAITSPMGWLTIYCPLLMLYFLLYVSGVKITEELALRTKGDAYRHYQATTSKFIPWFKKGI